MVWGNLRGAAEARWLLLHHDASCYNAGRQRAAARQYPDASKENIVERTLVIIKPDAVQRGLIGEIIRRFERRGLRIAGLKMVQVSEELARQHYAVHEGKPFFPGLIQFITSGPVVVMALEGSEAIAVTRATMGVTAPGKAVPGTIRADFAMDIGYNLVHGSDGPDTAVQELALWFGEGELVSYQRVIDGWIYE